uniref:C2H2-type domain-containing protein n=1 Tax=Steinernema glaseri TaxID=37863 RepID=A0A1I8AGE6_9BILA
MHRSSGAMASSDKKEFLSQCRDIKNTLVGLLESQKELRRTMMDYSARIGPHELSTSVMNNRESSSQIASAGEKEKGSSDEDGRYDASSEEKSEESDKMTEVISLIRVVSVCRVRKVRQHHIKIHEDLKVSCPVAGCSVTSGNSKWRNHLKREHNMTPNTLPAREKATLQNELDRNNERAINLELKYFPPTSLVSFSKTAGRDSVKPFCKKWTVRSKGVLTEGALLRYSIT